MHHRPALPPGPGRRLLSLVLKNWAGLGPAAHLCHAPCAPLDPGRKSLSRQKNSPQPESGCSRARVQAATHAGALAPPPPPPGTLVALCSLRDSFEYGPSGTRSELHPGPRRAPPRPTRPPRPLAPRLDPARTRGPAPHGCRATGGLAIVAPRRRLRPRASCPCVSSVHSWT